MKKRKTARRKKAAPARTAKKSTAAKKTAAPKARKVARRARGQQPKLGTRRPPLRAKTAARSAPAAAPSMAEAVASGGAARLVPHVAAALRGRGYDTPDAAIVETIATVGAGYRKGPASDPPFRIAVDADSEVARELVNRFVEGDRPSTLDLSVHRSTTRATVDFTLEQLDLGETGAIPRATLTSLSLGSWDPARDEVAKRNAIPGFIVRWYRDGRG
jgi:hypothetical protein